MMTETEREEFKEGLEDKGLNEVEELQERGVYGASGERPDLVEAFIKREKRKAEADHQESVQDLAQEANRIAKEASKRAGIANWVALGSLLLAGLALLKAFGII